MCVCVCMGHKHSYADDELAWGFSDVYGSFSVRNHTLSQLATGKPDGWAPTNFDPLTYIGDPTWSTVKVTASAMVNHTAEPQLNQYIRVCGGCVDQSIRVIQYGCDESCCFNLSYTGDWSVGKDDKGVSGKIDGFEDTWHAIALDIGNNGTVTASVDGKQVVHAPNVCQTPGMVGLGCGSYHQCAFKDFALDAK